MSRVVPGLFGIFGPRNLVVMFCRTSRGVPSCSKLFQNVPSCPRTSSDICSGIVRKVRGSPGHVSRQDKRHNIINKVDLKFMHAEL